jgi:hypothetical protein
MEIATIFEFLFGAYIGTVLTLMTMKAPKPRQRPSSSTFTHRVKTFDAENPSQLLTKTLGDLAPSTEVRPVGAETVGIVDANPMQQLRDNLLSCPSCGLAAPEGLMSEHFNGSPSHRHATQASQQVCEKPERHRRTEHVPTEQEIKNSVRRLLQLLAPPRPFARRDRQLRVNEVSNMLGAALLS